MEKTQHLKIHIMFMKVEKMDLVNVIENLFSVYYFKSFFIG
jgi:hypothetical protein